MKKLLVGCVLAIPTLIGLASLWYTPKAEAAPSQGCTTWYYSDSTHTELVGQADLTCEGHYVLSGVKTAYYEKECYACW